MGSSAALSVRYYLDMYAYQDAYGVFKIRMYQVRTPSLMRVDAFLTFQTVNEHDYIAKYKQLRRVCMNQNGMNSPVYISEIPPETDE